MPVFAGSSTASAFPAFAPHFEVWLLLAAVVAGGLYVARVIGPKVVEPGEQVVSRRQAVSFWAAVVLMTAVSVWPVHDIAEQRLYTMHMVQHFTLTFVVPPLFLLACPAWLAALVIRRGGWAWKVIHTIGRPLPAWLIFNSLQVFAHWPAFVTLSVTNGPFHFTMHVLFLSTALLMWVPVCGPWPEMRLSIPGQMIYLFAQSILPTVPAAWLTVSDSVIYPTYADAPRLWGLSAHEDQVVAGLFMKVFEAAYLWTLIAIMFFRWAARHLAADRDGRFMTEREILEYEEGNRAGLDKSPVPNLTPGTAAEPTATA